MPDPANQIARRAAKAARAQQEPPDMPPAHAETPSPGVTGPPGVVGTDGDPLPIGDRPTAAETMAASPAHIRLERTPRVPIRKNGPPPHVEWEYPLADLSLPGFARAIDLFHNAQALVHKYCPGLGCFRTFILDIKGDRPVLRARWHGTLADASRLARINSETAKHFRRVLNLRDFDEKET